ncbi:alpha/beta hydrolase [Enterococcus sp. AZ109]|uniref:alpha/beta hydrolase n=1 Tax=Enterococcus sp. AZ109 TaxID=2774634 RepID=UPI003F29B48A
MRRKFTGGLTVLVVVSGLMISLLNQESVNEDPVAENSTTVPQIKTKDSTEPVILSEDQRGSLETISYQTAFEDVSYDKSAQIYLPAGYEENSHQQYDVLYLLHGHTIDYQDFLTDRDTGEDSAIKEMLDRLIAADEIKPLIVVSPTYYPDRSMIESSWSADDPLNLRFATEELSNDLIPTVEETYRTYANSVSRADLEASRQHRAFAGFSMGAITTWYVFEHQLTLFSKFIPMAGDSWTVQSSGGSGAPAETAEKLAQ